MANTPQIQGPQVQLPDVSSSAKGQAKKTAQDFEAVFIGEMTKTMFDTVPTDDRFGGGSAEKIYGGMLAEQLGKSIAQKGGIGIAPKVMNEIIKMQEGK